MPAAVAAAAYVVGQAAFAVSSVFLPTSAAIGVQVAAAGFVASLGGLAGVGAAVSAWSTVAGIAALTQRPKIKVGASEGGGTQIDFKADPNAPLPLAFGRTAVSGNIVHITTDGQAYKNAHVLYLSVLSLGPIEAYDGFKAGDISVTFAGEVNGGGMAAGGTGPGGGADNRYDGQMITRNYLGSEAGIAVPWVPDRIPEWTAAHKLSGLASAWYGLNYDAKVYPTGTPKPQWVVKGAKAYDARLDSTYAGGAGACRADDPATWVWSENPYVLALTWCLGWQANGVRVMGVGAPTDNIDVAAFVEGANVADANGWTCGGVVTSSDAKWDVLSALLQAGAGAPSRLGAKISCVVSTPRVSLATLTRDDVVGDVTIAGTAPRRDRINRVVPRYRSEDHGWQMVSGGAVAVADYITEDGGQRSREVDYPLVQDAAQAAQLAAYAIVDGREFGPITLPLKPLWLGYKPGDCITVDAGEDLALDEQKVLILARDFDPASGVVTFTCRSETDAKHDFALGRTGTPPPTPGLEGVDPGFVPTPEEGDWAIVDNKVSGPGGIVPAIVVAGDVGDAQVNEIFLDYRRSTNPPTNTEFEDWVPTVWPASTERMEVLGVAAGATYQAAVRYRNLRGVEGGEDERFDLGFVTAAYLVPPGGVDPDDDTPPGPPENLTALPAFGGAALWWDNPSDLDLSHIRMYDAETEDFGVAELFDTVVARPNVRQGAARLGLPPNTGRFYWVTAVDASGNESEPSNSAFTTSATVSPTDLGTTIGFNPPTGLDLTSAVALDTDGSQIVTLRATWDAIVDAAFSLYEIAVQEGTGSFVVFTAPDATWELRGVKANTSYTAKVRGVDRNGNRTLYGVTDSHTTTKDNSAPAAPSGLSGTGGVTSVFLSWTNPTAADLDKIEIYRNTSNNSVTATKIGTVNAQSGQPGGAVDAGRLSGVTYWYFLKAVDTSGNTSAFTAGASVTTALVDTADLAVNAVTAEKVLAGSLTGDRFNTATSLPGTITVGSTGVSIGTIESRASDPAARVNANSTLITPGRVQLTGSTTLSSLLHGGDQTLINGGKIAGNTILLNSAEIGLRGVELTGCVFEFNSPSTNRVSWSAGRAEYVDNSGSLVSEVIAAGSMAFDWASGVVYFTWTPGAGVIAYTTSAATANAAGKVKLAFYRGGANLTATYGRTRIDGDLITTFGIKTHNLDSAVVTSAKIGALQILGEHVAANTLVAHDVIITGSLTYLQAEARTFNDYGFTEATPALFLTNTDQNCVSRSLSTGDDDLVEIDLAWTVENSSGISEDVYFNLYRGATLLRPFNDWQPAGPHTQDGYGAWKDYPPANSSVTYTLKANRPNGAVTFEVQYARIGLRRSRR